MEMQNRSSEPIGFKSKEPLVFSNSVVCGASSSGQITFQIDSTYDFNFFRFSYKSSGGFKIQFANDQKMIFKNPVSNSVFAGLQGSTYIGLALWHAFKTPYLCNKNSNLIAYITDTSGSSNTVEIIVDGVKYVYNS